MTLFLPWNTETLTKYSRCKPPHTFEVRWGRIVLTGICFFFDNAFHSDAHDTEEILCCFFHVISTLKAKANHDFFSRSKTIHCKKIFFPTIGFILLDVYTNNYFSLSMLSVLLVSL